MDLLELPDEVGLVPPPDPFGDGLDAVIGVKQPP